MLEALRAATVTPSMRRHRLQRDQHKRLARRLRAYGEALGGSTGKLDEIELLGDTRIAAAAFERSGGRHERLDGAAHAQVAPVLVGDGI